MMNYSKFCEILNKHIFEGEKRELLKKLAENPERFIGLFRPSRPGTKILQYLLQSHEIRFGDAWEELIEETLKDLGYKTLPKTITASNGDQLYLDQFFTDGKKYYFIEQKIRDDHDSTKKRGQIKNFEAKLKELFKQYENNVVGIMYFIDPTLKKNKNFYSNELNRMGKYYKVSLYLFYGRELFDFLKVPDYWDELLTYLSQWKDSLPEIPEINFDVNPEESFNAIKDLEIRYWIRLLENEDLWEEGIMKAIFRSGETLRLVLNYFNTKSSYQKLSELFNERLKYYYK